MAAARELRDDDKRELQEARVSLVRHAGPIGGLATFNMEFGFLEALLRGLKSGFLKPSDYKALCSCENLDDVKMQLTDTDYASALTSVMKLTPEIILTRCQNKWVSEFFFIHSQAVGALSTFLDFITWEYLIQSISFVIISLIKGSDRETLLSKIHPMGRSPHLKAILHMFENGDVTDALVELYRTVLVDTPVAGYYERYFNSELKTDEPGKQIGRVYSEVEVDIITNMLQKLWLEDFYVYTQSLGGETALIMKELLEFEADRRAISITINSFGTSLNDPHNRESERKALFCNFGTLYPETTMNAFTKVGDMSQLAAALQPYPMFRSIFEDAKEGQRSVTDQLYIQEVKLNKLAFDSQSHFACFYAYIKLKRQEERNLKWILSCINQRRPEKDRQRWIGTFV